MPSRPRMEEALGVLRSELDAGRSPVTELTTRDAWLAYLRFGRQRFDTAPTPDCDGLLFQYGTYAFNGTPMFTLDLTRQFAVVDADGEHDHYLQVHCELRYEPTADLEGLGSFNSWFFHDADADFGPWADAMGGRLVPLIDCTPSEVELYEEQV
ncbi:hypothetical protein [Streptomyces cinnamoneus]|uniref:Uncharacterized protein n=1 Tax=Streptomyces cinnamoneus TaxID=53446 RepID=A0A918WR86_STRCJ|nr:hypothetical protein [Streptomyces cinnamoneus]GHC73319.1 hypothetical protein GCM10010507_60670 [Streptomyces cinnamoneus]